MINENYPPDPDQLPFVNPEELRRRRMEHKKAQRNYLRQDLDEGDAMTEYVSQNSTTIDRIMGSTGLRLVHDAHIWSGVATVPVDILAESPEQVAEVTQSIGNAAEKMDQPVHYIPWLNFYADPRREQDKVVQAKKKAELLSEAIRDNAHGSNIASNIAVDHLPYRTTIAAIRQRMLLGALGLFVRHAVFHGGKNKGVQPAVRNPYLSLDADTTIDKDAFLLAKEPLELNQALFVSGNLQYVGGIMEKDIAEIKKEPEEMRLLYVVEHMRRLMLNSLPPTHQRSYLSETGMATKLSTLANLGGFNVRAENNESYWLQVAAEEATRHYLERRAWAPRRPPTLKELRGDKSVFISDDIGLSLESITRYEDYSINTSIEGIERNVRKYGAAAVAAFDCGHDYIMRTDFNKSPVLAADSPHLRTHPVEVMNAAYSYYKLGGGELTMEGLFKMNQLLRDVDVISEVELKVGQLPWTPQFVPKENWPVKVVPQADISSEG